MRKVVTLLAVVIASLSLVASTASASGSGGEVIYSEFACVLPDGNGNAFVTYNSTLTLYANQQGAKLVLRCSGYDDPAPYLRYFNYGNTGQVCGVFIGATTDWSAKVGRNGNSQLTCTLQLDGEDLTNIAASGGSAGVG